MTIGWLHGDSRMGFSRYLPPPPKTYKIPLAALPDEQDVRRVLQRQYHRPRGESWAESSRRIAGMNKKQICREVSDGGITPSQAKRRRQCTPPNSRLHKKHRRNCHHHACPWCRYRLLLATFRAVYHKVVQPEREAREKKGRARTGARNRLVSCRVKITTSKEVSIQSTLAAIVREQLVRKIQRAGEITDGLAITSINDLKSKSVITVSVLGISQKPVQHRQPEVQVSLDPRIAVTRLVPPGTPVDTAVALCERVPDIVVETDWKAAIKGHDCPVFGTTSLLRLLAPMMPRVRDATGIRCKRFQPLGTWRAYLQSRMEMPEPIIYERFRPQVVEVPVEAGDLGVEAEKRRIESSLAKLRGLANSRVDIPQALSSPEEDFSASFRYAFGARAGLSGIASQFHDRAVQELRLNKDRLDAMTDLLPQSFVQEVYDSMGAWRDDPTVRQTRLYVRDKWYHCGSAVDRRHDHLTQAVLRGLMRFCGRELGLDKMLVGMVMSLAVHHQRDLWRTAENPHGYFDLNDYVLPRMEFPRSLVPVWLSDCADEPLAGVAGYIPPPKDGGPSWDRITGWLDDHNDPNAAFVVRPPGHARGLAVIHQDAGAVDRGSAKRIGRTKFFIQDFDSYMSFCWENWDARPQCESDLFAWLDWKPVQ